MILEGLSVPVPTLYGAEGEIDRGKNAKFARTLSEAKVDHLFALGSLGEFPLVTEKEREGLLEVVIESTVSPTDVWVGCGAPSTRQAVAYAEAAEGAGAAAVVAVPPYYLHPTPNGIEGYYRAIRAAVSIPLLAYNIPSLVGYPLPPSLVHGLARDGVLAGVKDTAGSLDSVRGFLEGAPEGFAVFPGDDALVLPAIERGAAGGVMGVANLVPRLCVELVRAARKGDSPRAQELAAVVEGLVAVARAGPFPASEKFLAAHLWGADVGYRSPYDPLSEAEQRAVLEQLAPLKPHLEPFLRR